MNIIDICNIALSTIGQSTITDLNERSVEAKQCNIHYAVARDEVLREFPWCFATGSVNLALTTNKITGWSYAYQYPSNALALRRVFDINDALNTTKTLIYDTVSDGVNKYIVCQIPSACAEITYSISDPNLFDSQFISALALKLAVKLILPLTSNDSRKNALYQEYVAVLRSAQLSSASENNFTPQLSQTYIDVRR